MLKFIFISIGIAFATTAFGASDDAPRMSFDELIKHPGVVYENQANNSFYHATFDVEIEHFEIPLFALKQTQGFMDIPVEILNSLIFERDGQKWVRWIIYPFDNYYGHVIEDRLRELDLPAKRHKYFRGVLKASRSLLLHDPVSNVVFGVKVPTGRLAEHYELRKLPNGKLKTIVRYREQAGKSHPFDEAEGAIKASAVLRKLLVKNPLTYSVLIEDLGALGTWGPGTESMSIRSGKSVKNGRYIFIPAFSLLHETTGIEIAKRNGSSNPTEYWKKNLVEVLGRATAELFVKTGCALDSPHAQNFYLQFDRETMQPTGVVGLHDLGDTLFLESRLKELELPSKEFSGLRVFKNSTPIEFWPLGATNVARNAPSWLTPKAYDQWADAYYEAFEKEGFKQSSRFAGLSRRTDKRNHPSNLRFVAQYRRRYTVRPSPLSCPNLFEGTSN